MKKYLIVLIVISICLFLPMHARASQSEIETTVPTTHTVVIEAKHASAQYVQGDLGLSSAYAVPRFSDPKFKIAVEEGYQIKRVLLNGKDVTKKIKKNTLKLSEVCEDQVIKIETEATKPEDSQDTPDNSQDTPDAQSAQQTDKKEDTATKQETGKQTYKTEHESGDRETEIETDESDAYPESVEAEDEQAEPDTEDLQEQEEIGQTTQGGDMPDTEAENEKHFSFWWIILLVVSAGVLVWIILLLKKRKKDNAQKENMDS